MDKKRDAEGAEIPVATPNVGFSAPKSRLALPELSISLLFSLPVGCYQWSSLSESQHTSCAMQSRSLRYTKLHLPHA